MEQFLTLQGEGYHAGRSAYFIRIAGCDVGCHWCDVKESWDAANHPIESIENILNSAKKSKSDFIVITGGEPLMYSLDNLCNKLIESQFTIALETSGAYPLSGSWHWICLSPKKFKTPLIEVFEKANELKMIIYNKSDFKWAEENAKQVKQDCELYLQVEWSQREKMNPLVIDYIKQNPKWKLSTQSHKYLNIP